MRLELQARTELTLKLITALQEGTRLRAGHLAERAGSTATYVAQLMAPLTRAGWVQSSPGPTGGYELVAGLGAVTLLDLIEVVEGPTDTERCVMADRICLSAVPCALHDAWTRARRALTTELAAIPLSTLTTIEEGALR
ncbi:MAG: Rrf2 family transcriptional regulator [Ilumatobacter sp.]|nr:Rrf2 family transcriptional regulator [Ilumatobacter sp.]